MAKIIPLESSVLEHVIEAGSVELKASQGLYVVTSQMLAVGCSSEQGERKNFSGYPFWLITGDGWVIRGLTYSDLEKSHIHVPVRWC